MRLTACWLLAIGLMGTGGGFAGEPSRQVVWDEAAARHLLSRACFGGTPEQAKRLAAMPLEMAVDELLDRAIAARSYPRPDWVAASGSTPFAATRTCRARSTSSPSAAPVRGMTRNSRI